MPFRAGPTTGLRTAFPRRDSPRWCRSTTRPGCNYAQNPTVVDLAVVYTPSALSWMGGSTQDMESLVDTVVAANNLIYFNSGIGVMLELVYSGEVNYTESGDVLTDLSNMTIDPNIQGIRNTFGADLVSLWFNGSDSVMGMAFIYGFYNVEHIAFTESLFHEVGHNFGCSHDHIHGPTVTPNYAYGGSFNALGVQYTDIMSYMSGVRVPYFSNPNITYQGVPTGVADTAANAADCARQINEEAVLISQAEPTLATLPDVNITSPPDGSVFTSPLTLSVTAAASDSDGTVSQVDFYGDGLYLGTQTSAPYTVDWPLVPSGSHFITAHAIDNQGSIKFSCPVSIYVNSTLPSPWMEQDIGWLIQYTATPMELKYVGMSGSGSYSGGTFTVNGAGSGMGMNLTGKEEDSFQFLNQPSCGDSTFIARLTGFQNGSTNSQAGIMFRNNSNPLSPYAFIGTTQNGNNIVFLYRTSQGGNSSTVSGANLAAPTWFKLQRSGNSFSGYESPDGSSWTLVGSATIPMGKRPRGGFRGQQRQR